MIYKKIISAMRLGGISLVHGIWQESVVMVQFLPITGVFFAQWVFQTVENDSLQR
jgi:hypothetical protein